MQTTTLFLALFAAGCASMEGDENVATTSEELGGLPTTYQWTAGTAPLAIGNVSSVACFLTGVSGSFTSNNDHVALVSVNGQWTLSGSGHVDWAQARCTSWHTLGVGANPTLTSRTAVSGGLSFVSWYGAVALADASQDLCWLTGFVGDESGGRGGEVTTPPPPVGEPRWIVKVTSTSGNAAATATCAVSSAGYSLPIHTLRGSASSWTQLMPTSDGTCFLQSAEGLLSGESTIVESGGSWWLWGAQLVDCVEYPPTLSACLPPTCY
jgi:hypothetical protein